MRATRFLLGLKWQYALGEAILIIMGVTAALAVDEWRQERNEAQVADEYLTRLAQEIEQDIEGWQRLDSIYAKKIDRLDAALEGVLNPDYSVPAVTEFLNNLTLGARHAYYSGQDNTQATFRELISTGRMAFIEELSVRQTIMGYEQFIESELMRVDSRQTRYAATIYELIPRDPEFLVREDLSEDRLISIAKRTREYDLEGLINAERNRARLQREVSKNIIERASETLLVLQQ